MHVRAVAAATTALMGGTALLLPTSTAHAADRAADRAGRPLVVAHRGASAYAPENTLAAVDKAASMGFSWVENDVQRTKDGKLVVIHDATLARTTNVEQVFPGRAPWNVKDFTAREIARLDAGSWFAAGFRNARVPTLEQYLNRLTRNRQNLVLEIKNPQLYPGIEKQTLKVLGDKGWLGSSHVKSRLVVQSFSTDTVRTVHRLRPAVRTGFLGKPAVSDLSWYATFSDQINTSHTSISRGYVAAVHTFSGPHGKPLQMLTWTVNDAANARRAAGFGVDGIITNKPDVVRDATAGSVAQDPDDVAGLLEGVSGSLPEPEAVTEQLPVDVAGAVPQNVAELLPRA
jgi:glycerophosphoryl diester phosphodiesterase